MAKKSNHPGKIPIDIIEKIYLDWVEEMPLRKLKQKYNVSLPTIVKYRNEQDWEGRKAKIQNVVAKRTDKTLAQRKARRARLGVTLQAEGLKSIRKGIAKQGDAINAMKLGAEFEDQGAGEVDESMTITIKMPKGFNIGNRLNRS